MMKLVSACAQKDNAAKGSDRGSKLDLRKQVSNDLCVWLSHRTEIQDHICGTYPISRGPLYHAMHNVQQHRTIHTACINYECIFRSRYITIHLIERQKQSPVDFVVGPRGYSSLAGTYALTSCKH
jgi:hypothetical protein